MKVEVSCYQHLYRAEQQNLTLNAPQWSCSSVCWCSALCCHLVVEHQPLSGRSPEQVTGQWRHHDSGFIMLISVNETQLRVHVHRQNNMEVWWCYSEVLQQLTDADFLSQPVGVITSCPAAALTFVLRDADVQLHQMFPVTWLDALFKAENSGLNIVHKIKKMVN